VVLEASSYDHVPPPWDAATPDAESETRQPNFRFDRFGVRVPAVVISPLIEAGTVFRSPTQVPLDHTVILATLRDWLQIPPQIMLASKRVAHAPTLEFLLTRDDAQTDMPIIGQPQAPRLALVLGEDDIPLSDLQFGLAIAAGEDGPPKSFIECVAIGSVVEETRHFAHHFQEGSSPFEIPLNSRTRLQYSRQ
jgi:hypothetical protein